MKSDLVINAPRQGIAQSPHVGFADVRNLDLSFPGIVRLNNLVAKASSTTVVTTVQWMVTNPATPTEKYALDSAGKVYKSTDTGATWALMTGNTQTSCHGNGLAIFKNYLVVAPAAFLDVCGDGSATGITNANWSNSWKAIDSDVLWHPMLISSNDGKLYGGAGRYVYSLEEVSGQTFAPGTAGTYTFTAQALDLPSNYRIKCIEELGNNLMCGTWQGVNVYDLRIADIYTWDRSAVSFGQPVKMCEHGVSAMLNTGNSLIVLAGIGGTVYRCDGVNAIPIAQIPQGIADISGGKYLEWLPGAICNYKGKVFFGVSSGGSATTIDGMGVYSLLQTGQGNILNLEHGISTGNYGATTTVKIGALLPVTRDNLLIGWRDDTTYGIDNITVTSFNTSYSGYFISPLYIVGTHGQPRKFSELEIQLERPLRTNEGIKVAYRPNLTASFTDIGTYDFATYGAELSHNAVFYLGTTNMDIAEVELIEIKVSLTGTTTTPGFRNVILR